MVEINPDHGYFSSRAEIKGILNDKRTDGKIGARIYTCWLMIWLSNTFGWGTVEITDSKTGIKWHVSKGSLNKLLGLPADIQNFNYLDLIQRVITSIKYGPDGKMIIKKDPKLPTQKVNIVKPAHHPDFSPDLVELTKPAHKEPEPVKKCSFADILKTKPGKTPLLEMLDKNDTELRKAIPDFDGLFANTPEQFTKLMDGIEDPRVLILIGMHLSQISHQELACQYYLAAAKKSEEGRNMAEIQLQHIGDPDVRCIYEGQMLELKGSDHDLLNAVKKYLAALEHGCKQKVPSCSEVAEKITNKTLKIQAYHAIVRDLKEQQSNNVKAGKPQDQNLLNELQRCYNKLIELGEPKGHYHLARLAIDLQEVEEAIGHFKAYLTNQAVNEEIMQASRLMVKTYTEFPCALYFLLIKPEEFFNFLLANPQTLKNAVRFPNFIESVNKKEDDKYPQSKYQHPIFNDETFASAVFLQPARMHFKNKKFIAAEYFYTKANERKLLKPRDRKLTACQDYDDISVMIDELNKPEWNKTKNELQNGLADMARKSLLEILAASNMPKHVSKAQELLNQQTA